MAGSVVSTDDDLRLAGVGGAIVVEDCERDTVGTLGERSRRAEGTAVMVPSLSKEPASSARAVTVAWQFESALTVILLHSATGGWLGAVGSER